MELLISGATLLFLTMDPLGNIPIFLSVLNKVRPERRLKVVIRELLLALGLLLIFLYFGRNLLALLHLSQEAIQMAGGIILFMIAVKMVFPAVQMEMDDKLDGEPLLVPLAIPMITGPSALATLLILANDRPDSLGILTLAVFLAWGATAIILLAATPLERFLGQRGLIALERLMGMLLVVISVQMFLDGIANFVQS